MANTSDKPVKTTKTLVVRRPQRGNSVSWLYLLPAVFMSILLNGSLMGALFLLSSPSKAHTAPTELASTPDKEISVVKEEKKPDPESESRDPFKATPPDEDPDSAAPAVTFADPKIPSEPVIPGLGKPTENPVVGGAPDITPFNPPPIAALGGFGMSGVADSGPLSGMSVGPPSLTSMPGIPNMTPGGFGPRTGEARDQALRQGGGTPQSELAVKAGLRWLQSVQHPDGKWQLDGPYPEKGHRNDVAGTAFGLLPFLAAGHTHVASKDNPYDKPIEKGLLFLINRQDKSTGAFAVGVPPHQQMYTHALATIAMCEAYGLTRDQNLGRSARNGINYIVRTQHVAGGWRYQPGQQGDTSVVGWMVMALKSGQLAKLDVPEVTMSKAILYLDHSCNNNTEGYGYVGKGSSPTMSAVGLLCRQYLQYWGPSNPRMIKGVEMNLKRVPPGAMKNMYYYYYATQVMHHFGGQSWEIWNAKMREELIATQTKDGAMAGSWSPAGDHWGQAGGRLMQTSLSLLTLEVYYRHLPLFQRQKAAE